MSVDLSSSYLGLPLRSPLVASAGPLTGEVDSLKRLNDAGVGAVVLPSLFEEQIEHDADELEQLVEVYSNRDAEGLSPFPSFDAYDAGPTEYLEKIELARSAVDVPVIASLNGQRVRGWARFARHLEDAGADAIELNVYRVISDPMLSASDVEQQYADLVAAVCNVVSIPVAVKIGAHFTALPNFAKQLEAAGAEGLVLFNRFLHPDIDLESLAVQPHLTLSHSGESLQVVRWIAILRDLLQMSLAATSGVHTAADAVKLLLVGADVTMMTSALLRRGPSYAEAIRNDLEAWLESHEYLSVNQMRGSMSMGNVDDPAGFERANYMQALISYSSESS